MSEKQVELANMAAELLQEIAGQAGETEEAVEFGRSLYALSKVDDALANRVVAAVSAFFAAHAQLVAVRFYREGEQAGRQQARLQQAQRRGARPTERRLQ